MSKYKTLMKDILCLLTISMNIQKEQEGSIGIVLHAAWFEPISNSTPDKLAAERAQSFFLNW